MTETNSLAIPIWICAGLLVAVGGLRLAGFALAPMPRVTALALVVTGLILAAAGPWLVARPGPDEPPEPVPTLELSTPDPDTTPEPAGKSSVVGVVRDPDGPVAGVAVELNFFEGTEKSNTQTIETAPDGSYAFNDVDRAAANAFTVTVTYQNIEFGTDVFVLGAEPAIKDIRVAPPGAEQKDVRVLVDSMVVSGDSAGLEILQVLTIENRSDFAFTDSFELPLLSSASGFVPQKGLVRGRLRFSGEDKLTTTQPMLPGRTEIAYTYLLPAIGSEATIQREAVAETATFTVAYGPDLTVTGDGLSDGRDFPAQKGYTQITGSNLEAGEPIELTVKADRTRDSSPSGVPVGAVVVGVLILAAVIGWPIVRKRGSE